MKSVKKNERVWPSEVKDWKYFNDKEEWMIDPQLTVTGNTVYSLQFKGTVSNFPLYFQYHDYDDITISQYHMCQVSIYTL